MPELLGAAVWGAAAAMALLVGACVAFLVKPSVHATGLVMGFGAGALIGAVAYDLIPDSELINLVEIALAFTSGALVFFFGDQFVNRIGGRKRSRIPVEKKEGADSGTGVAIFLGTLLDGIPESLILGMSIAIGGSVGLGFMVAVVVSNIPEGIAGTVDLQEGGLSRRTISLMWLGLVGASSVAAALGYFLAEVVPMADGAWLNAFAAGAIITMLANTMMPEAFENGGKQVGLLTALGFILAGVLSAFE